MINNNDYDYWVYQDYLIFKPSFNKQPNDELLSSYNKIIFSNYRNPIKSIKNNNKLNYDDTNYWLYSRFNQPLNLPNSLRYLILGLSFDKTINLPLSLIHLTFGNHFNKPVNLGNCLLCLTFGDNFNQPINLVNSLTHLTFGYKFNQPIDLPNSLIYLIFCENFNQPINLPNCLKYLTIGYCFNHEVNLPLGLKYLKLNALNQYIVDNLVNTIEELVLDFHFDLELKNLPNSIRKIIFLNEFYNYDLNLLPDSIEFIGLPMAYVKKILQMPKSLKTIKCHYTYKFINDLKKKNIRIEIY
jgi:hypothetical protein